MLVFLLGTGMHGCVVSFSSSHVLNQPVAPIVCAPRSLQARAGPGQEGLLTSAGRPSGVSHMGCAFEAFELVANPLMIPLSMIQADPRQC